MDKQIQTTASRQGYCSKTTPSIHRSGTFETKLQPESESLFLSLARANLPPIRNKRVRSTKTPVAAPHYCVEPPEQADSPWSHTPSRAGDDTNSKPLTRDTDKAVTGNRRRSSKGETRLAKEEASGAGTRAHAPSGRRSVFKTTFKSREKSLWVYSDVFLPTIIFLQFLVIYFSADLKSKNIKLTKKRRIGLNDSDASRIISNINKREVRRFTKIQATKFVMRVEVNQTIVKKLKKRRREGRRQCD
ncbi:hypothetical protein YC2023_090985 [Brassica napus]